MFHILLPLLDRTPVHRASPTNTPLEPFQIVFIRRRYASDVAFWDVGAKRHSKITCMSLYGEGKQATEPFVSTILVQLNGGEEDLLDDSDTH